jgi:alanine dehydrogenase
VFAVDGILHYCVANMPGAVPLTSTRALTNATLPYALTLATKGWHQAAQDDPGIGKGVNMVAGQITCQGVAEAFGLPYTPLEGLPG